MGVRSVGLDVRVGHHGNFGATLPEGRENSITFCRTARNLGIHATCFLTDGTMAYQPYVGRSEALLAIRALIDGTASQWLLEHNHLCRQMALTLRGGSEPTSALSLRDAFTANLEAQGSNYTNFLAQAGRVEAAPRFPIRAPLNGFVRIDLGTLRLLLGKWQSGGDCSASEYPDACGVTLVRQYDEFVHTGDVIALVRCPHEAAAQATEDLARAFGISDVPLRAATTEIIESVG
ncbi:MAG: hypothetical protein AB1714_19480 [Acidobacteriota bacterium]